MSNPASISLTLPLPPSINHYRRRNRDGSYRYSKYTLAFRAEVALICLASDVIPLEGEIAIHLRIFRARRHGDLDNFIKVLLDALEGRCYLDDRQVVELHAFRRDDRRNPRVEILILPL